LAGTEHDGDRRLSPVNAFRKGDDFVILAEVPGVKKSDLDIQVKDQVIRIAGTKSIDYGEKASLHRRERSSGRFNRTFTIPVRIDADRIKAECRDGILALYLPRAEQDKPKSIKIA
jgi:HSP20 family protein